jgi:hypothetical protein
MTTPVIPRPTWTCAQLAASCGISTDTVWRWCRNGTVTASRVGKSYYIPAAVAEAILSGSIQTKSAKAQS